MIGIFIVFHGNLSGLNKVKVQDIIWLFPELMQMSLK